MIMRKGFPGLILLTSIAIGLVGCGSSSGEDDFDPLTDPQLLPVARCTALHTNGISRLTERLQQLFDRINGGPLVAGITENVQFSDYTVELDLERDGLTDITVDIDIIAVSDITDGFQVGELVTINFNFTGVIAGTGSAFFSFGAGQLRISQGSFDLNDSGSCSLQSPNLTITWNAGNLDSAYPNFPITTMEGTDVFNGHLFGDLDDDDYIAVAGQLSIGGNPATTTVFFAISLDTFDVFED